MAWTDRLINLFRGRQLAREIDEELSFHLESRIRDNVAAGMTPEEAAAPCEGSGMAISLQRGQVFLNGAAK